MLNYMRGELYRSFNRKYFWVFTAIVAGLGLAMNIILKVNHVNTGLTDIFDSSVQMLGVPVFLVVVFIDMVTAEEQKNLTMRNVITFGIPRSKFVLAKVLVTTIIAFVSACIIIFVTYGSGALLFGLGKNFPGTISSDLFRIVAALPLWTGAIAIGTFLALLLSNTTAFAFAYAGTFVVISNIIKVLRIFVSANFSHLNDLLITTQIGRLGNLGTSEQEIICAALLGICYTIVFTLISIVYFNRKEIK